MKIDSRQNPTIKRLRELRESKARREQGRFLIDGPREAQRALEKKIGIVAAYVCKDFPVDEKLLGQLRGGKIDIIEVSRGAFETVCYRENPSGILIEAKTWDTSLGNLKLKKPTFVAIAEDIEKPGNLGTLLRSCDAAGVEAVIGCNETVDLFNPNALRASAAAAFSVLYATASRSEALAWAKQNGLKIVATSPAAQKTLWEINLKEPVAIAIGSEAHGLTPEFLAAADEAVSLPMRGLGDSLNVSVATGVMLYEVLRQRR
jgi:TrmH family RNA methyltransferase